MHGLNNFKRVPKQAYLNLKYPIVLSNTPQLCVKHIFEICSGIGHGFSSNGALGTISTDLRGWPFDLGAWWLNPMEVGREAPQHEADHRPEPSAAQS